MNYYLVTQAHDDRRVGDTIVSNDPRDAYFMSIGFLRHVGSDEPEPVAPKGRGRGIKVGSGSPSPAGVRDEGSDPMGGEDGSAG